MHAIVIKNAIKSFTVGFFLFSNVSDMKHEIRTTRFQQKVISIKAQTKIELLVSNSLSLMSQ